MTCQCLRSLCYWSGGLNKTENGNEVRTHKKKIDYLSLLKAGMKKNIKSITQKKNLTINKLSNI
jgi:hypothetical protein